MILYLFQQTFKNPIRWDMLSFLKYTKSEDWVRVSELGGESEGGVVCGVAGAKTRRFIGERHRMSKIKKPNFRPLYRVLKLLVYGK